MSEYIERESLISNLKDLPEQERIEYMGIYDCIKSQHTADVVEIRHGKWIESSCYNICSVCEKYVHAWNDDGDLQEFAYCPNCGAKMDGDTE